MTDINREVAEKLFNLTIISDWPCYVDPECGGIVCSSTNDREDLPSSYDITADVYETGAPLFVDGIGECHNMHVIPQYSTNISDAWLVVERMRELGFRIQIHADKKSWTCILSQWNYDDKFISHEDTAPLAIVLAALKCMGNRNEE